MPRKHPLNQLPISHIHRIDRKVKNALRSDVLLGLVGEEVDLFEGKQLYVDSKEDVEILEQLYTEDLFHVTAQMLEVGEVFLAHL